MTKQSLKGTGGASRAAVRVLKCVAADLFTSIKKPPRQETQPLFVIVGLDIKKDYLMCRY